MAAHFYQAIIILYYSLYLPTLDSRQLVIDHVRLYIWLCLYTVAVEAKFLLQLLSVNKYLFTFLNQY